MNLFLAQMSPERAGYAVGVIIGVLLFIGIFIFSLIAIVKAFTKKTTGWIVAGSIGGVLVLILAGIFAAGFIRGFTQAMRSRQTMRTNSATGGGTVIHGQGMAYLIKIPSDWIIQRKQKDFDLLANQRSLYLGVIAEEANLGSPQVVADIAQKNLKMVAEDIQWTEPVPVELDGRNWLRFTVTCSVEKIPFFYQYYVYAGPEGTFQIITWTFQNLADKSTARMNEVSQTFLFPK